MRGCGGPRAVGRGRGCRVARHGAVWGQTAGFWAAGKGGGALRALSVPVRPGVPLKRRERNRKIDNVF